MKQPVWRCNPASFTDKLTSPISQCALLSKTMPVLIPAIIIAALFAGSAVASTASQASGKAVPTAVVDPHARQATVTVAGTSSVHHYPTAFATAPEKPSINSATHADRKIASYNPFLWIFDVALHLNTDHDHDGHYSNFSLTLDLDTTFTATTVYAVLYLANEGGPWNEYAVTGNFTISGSGSADTFSLNAELDSGYPSGYYNHYIEVYDAHTHELIGTYGPEDSHQLYGLPIESRMHDDAFHFDTDITLSFSGAGSMGPTTVFFTLGCFMIRRRLQTTLCQTTGSV